MSYEFVILAWCVGRRGPSSSASVFRIQPLAVFQKQEASVERPTAIEIPDTVDMGIHRYSSPELNCPMEDTKDNANALQTRWNNPRLPSV